MVDQLRIALKLGLYGGITAVFLGLIGMVETFGARAIISGVISLGHTLLVITGLAMGYLTAGSIDRYLNPPHLSARRSVRGAAVGGGLVAGLVTGLWLAALVFIMARYNIRAVLVNASPALLELLTFGQSTGGGALRLVVVGAVVGTVGGALYVVPAAVRRPLVWGLVVVAIGGMLFDLLRITLTRPGWPTALSKLLFATRGLSIRGAIILFGATAVLNVFGRFLPGLFQQVVGVLVGLVPRWLRGGLVALLSGSLVLRLIWFLAIDAKDLALLPVCPALRSGKFAALSSCLTAIGTRLADREGSGLTSLGPAIAASITLVESLLVLGIAIVVVILIVQAVRWWQAMPEERARWRTTPPQVQSATRLTGLYVGIAVLAFLPAMVGVFPSEVLVNIGLFVLMGFGINIVVGFAGLLDLGYVAFFAVGAYTTALLISPTSALGVSLSFWAALPFVFVITAFAGVLVGLPVLRMRGDYLAIVTLGFGEIARFLALSDWLRPWLGGAQGILNIPNPAIGGLEFVGPQKLYYLLMIGSLVALFVSWRLQGSRVGRALVAMREDEQVADAMGINTVYYKLLAFAMGALIASLSGAVFAAKLGSIFPHSFNVIVSITALSLLIIGGIGSLPGVVAGAFALVGVPELLREFSEYRLLMYGAVLIVMMLVRPEGLLPSVQRARELHEEELAQDAWLKAAATETVAAPANPGPGD